MAIWNYKILSIFSGGALRSRAARLVATIGFVGTIDQILQNRFSVDVVLELGLNRISLLLTFCCFFLFVELIFFPKTVIQRVLIEKQDPQPGFITALLRFIKELKRRGKMSTIISIRLGLSHFLHLIGENEARRQLGEAAFSAAVELGDQVVRASILIDDLGWAIHASGDTVKARKNIQLGIKGALGVPEDIISDYVRSQLIVAKGYRHLAFIGVKGASSDDYLLKAQNVISALGEKEAAHAAYGNEISRDGGQLKHARAMLIAKELGLETEGLVSASDEDATLKTKTALQLTREASAIYTDANDPERNVKALKLEQRLCSALGDTTGALEASAQMEKLGRSLSVRYDRRKYDRKN